MSTPPRGARWSWRRRLGVAGVAVLALAVLVVVIPLLALRSAGVRARLLTRMTSEVDARFGVHATARDFALDVRRGVLDVDGLSLGAPGAAPFLTVERLHAEVDVASLRRQVIVVRSIAVRSPRLDLAAPVPALRTGGPEETGPPLRVDIGDLRVTGGAVANGTVPAGAAAWVSGWRVEGLELAGAYRAERAEIELQGATVEATRPGLPAVRLAVVAKVASAGKELTVSTLSVTGDGLDLQASGAATMADPPAASGELSVALQPDLLAPDLGAGGRVVARGQMAWPALTGEVSVEASGIAAEPARRWLDEGTFERFALAGTTVDASAHLTLDGRGIAHATGAGDATWRRGETRLAVLAAAVPPAERDPGFAIEAEVAAELLPDSPGSRTARAVVQLPDAGAARPVRLHRARAELDAGDLAAAYAELRELWPGLVPPADPAWPLVGALEARGEASGPLAGPTATLHAEWRPEAGSRFTLAAQGEPMARRGRGTVTLESLRLGVLRADLGGTVSGTVDAAGSPASWRAEATLDGAGLTFAPDVPAIDSLHLIAASDGRTLDVRELAVAQGERRLAAHGRADLALPLRHAAFDVHLERPLAEVAAADATLVLRDGVLTVRAAADTVAGPAAADLDVPLAALRAIPALSGVLQDVPVVVTGGLIHAAFAAPELDSCTLLPALGREDREGRVRAAAAGELWVDPADLPAIIGQVELRGLRVGLPGHEVVAGDAVRLVLGGRRAELVPLRLAADGIPLDLAAVAELTPGWDPAQDAPIALVARFEATARGAAPAGLLEPFLAGGQARGTFAFDLAATGTPSAPSGELRVSGDDVSLFWPTPYATRLEAPRLSARLAGGAAVLESGTFRLNDGRVDITGRRTAGGAVTAEVLLDSVRYRLDYGTRAVLSGGLELTLPEEGRGTLLGNVTVERGVLDRNIDLERELLPRFLAPTPSTGTESGFLDTIDVDVGVDTLQGVRVKNNLADLRAGWDRLTIGGTAWNPTIHGRIEVDPGGLVFAYGQTVRLDRAVATFTGDPVSDPLLDLDTTTSLEDPTIGQPPVAALLSGDLGAARGAGQAGQALSAGMAGYLGQRLSSSLGLGRLTLRPLLVFGETDPSARLNIEQEVSRYVSFAVSLDLRNAERQTYLLDLHGFERLPSLTAQGFTNDTGGQGVTVQQSLLFGGPRAAADESPRLDRLAVDAPSRRVAKAVRRAVGLRRGDRVRTDLDFDLEVELAQVLRDHGYPDAAVQVATRPSQRKPGRVDVSVTVVPGPHASFDFSGDRPPKGLRPVITGLYRTDGYELESVEEMRRATARALRSVGFLDPDVAIDVRREGSAGALADRVAAIHATGGRRADLARLDFVGLPGDEAQRLAAHFPTQLERAELAMALPDADRRVQATLASLGWRDARIAERSLSDDGERLRVAVEPGPRTTIAEIAITGVGPDEAARLLAVAGVREGQPARSDRIAAATLAVEDELRRAGFAAARVRAAVRDTGPHAVAVTFEVDADASSRIRAVSFAGLRWTSEALARRAAALKPGQPFDPGEVGRARARLLGLGVLASATAATTTLPDGGTAVTFTATEAPRFSLSYGVRWESDQGIGGVVDYSDRDLFGRALTLGLRGLYTRNWSEPAPGASTDSLHELTSGRMYFSAEDILASRFTVEVFAEERRELSWSDLATDRREAGLQLSRPLARGVTARLYGHYLTTHLYEQVPDPDFPFDLRISHPYVGVQLIVDRRDDPVQTQQGYFASADLSASGNFIGSDYGYLRGYGQLNTFLGVGALAGRQMTWAQSVRVGLARTSDESLVLDARFRAGGEFSVRGFERETLGPREDLGNGLYYYLGGEALLVINEELRVPLPFDLTGLVFVDAGQVWARTSELGTGLATSLGLGMRASTPLGVVRVDFARPLERRPGDPSYKLYLGFGNVF